MTESFYIALLVTCAAALPPMLVWVMCWDSQLKCFHWRTSKAARGDETIHTCTHCGASKVTRYDDDCSGIAAGLEVEVSPWQRQSHHTPYLDKK